MKKKVKQKVQRVIISLSLILTLSVGLILEVSAEETNIDEVNAEQTAGQENEVEEKNVDNQDVEINTKKKTTNNLTSNEDADNSKENQDVNNTDKAQNLEELITEIRFSESQYEYEPSGVEPKILVLVNGQVLDSENYDIFYENNTEIGQAKVFVTGKEDKGYSGTIEADFEIVRKSIESITPILKYKTHYYTGSKRNAIITMKDGEVTLDPQKDYKVTFSSNTEVGTAKAVIKGTGNYTGEVSTTYAITPNRVKSVKALNNYNSIKLSWSKVTGATGYQIYRKSASETEYKKLKTITSGNTLTYTNLKMKTGYTYYYKVRAFRKVDGKTVYGLFSKPSVKQKTQVVAPTVSEISRVNYYKQSVKWKKVEGATGYDVYRSSSSNGNYIKIGSTKGNSKVTFTDTNCRCGKYYYYKVKAYRTISGKKYYGNLSSEAKKGKTYLTKAKISKYTENYSTKVTLKWPRISGATGYEIYRATSKSGTYKKIKTITSGSTVQWTNTGLTSGKLYYYKIKAYRKLSTGDTVYSSTSDVYTKSKSGWRYVNGYKLYYNASGKLVKDVSNIIGKQSSYVIKVNKKKNTVTVYAKDGSNGYIIPVKAFVCSTGYATPTGTFYTPAKYRWHTLMGPCWGQWNTRIVGSILFHSVFYNSPNNNMTLSTSAYNKLGTTCSHGCVRLKAGDAKWIYDNCKLKTKVIIYNSSTSGPLGKPSSYKLKSSHRWDPTDPTAYYKCRRNGCH